MRYSGKEQPSAGRLRHTCLLGVHREPKEPENRQGHRYPSGAHKLGGRGQLWLVTDGEEAGPHNQGLTGEKTSPVSLPVLQPSFPLALKYILSK